LIDSTSYQTTFGSMVYPIMTRPNIAHDVYVVSKFDGALTCGGCRNTIGSKKWQRDKCLRLL